MVNPTLPCRSLATPKERTLRGQSSRAGAMARRSRAIRCTARVDGQSLLADVLRRRARQDGGGLRLAGRVADRTRSCSTGWRPSSCAPAGTSRRCRSPSSRARPTASRRTRRRSRCSATRRTVCWRAARATRLPAETIRDQALARCRACWSNKIGGPSVKPYQPPGLWEELADREPTMQDHGEGLYRRSLYTFWKRTMPPPTHGQLRRRRPRDAASSGRIGRTRRSRR